MPETIQADGTPVHPARQIEYLHKIQVRTRRPWSKQAMEQMRPHAKHIRQQFDAPRFPNGKPKIKEPWLTTMVCPDHELLRMIGTERVVYAEFAHDTIARHLAEAAAQVRKYDEHLVQRWHRGKDQHFEDDGSYTKFDQRVGMWFCYYPKVVEGAPRFHLEARVRGTKALNRIGVHLARDLIGFDHAAFWDRHLLLLEVDFEKFGRWHENRRLGQSRRTPRKSDRRIGTTLYRIKAETAEFQKFAKQFGGGHGKQRWLVDGDAPDRRITHRTVQRIVDLYGLNAPFLRRVDPINRDISRERPDVPANSGDLNTHVLADRQDMPDPSVSKIEGSLDTRVTRNSHNHGGLNNVCIEENQ